MEQNEKKIAAEAAVAYVQEGMIVGLGTGSTAAYAVKALGARVKAGLSVRAIATSEATRELAVEEQIPMIDFSQTTSIDLTIDGADEIDEQFNMIKGGGGALLREKVVAFASRQVITIIDSTKLVKCLGRFALPVEAIPFGWQVVKAKIESLGAQVTLRKQGTIPFITDNGNYILDARFNPLEDAKALESQLNQIPGVMVNGLFIGLATRLVMGKGSEVIIRERS
ncbi:ribose-5-phosphate isomerase RpiA [Deltaproteobacteria bacterium TL4]